MRRFYGGQYQIHDTGFLPPSDTGKFVALLGRYHGPGDWKARSEDHQTHRSFEPLFKQYRVLRHRLRFVAKAENPMAAI